MNTHAFVGATGRVDRLLSAASTDLPVGMSCVSLAQSVAGWPAGIGELHCTGGVLLFVDGRTLEQVRADKKQQINTWRLAANQVGFNFAGKRISTDTLSRSDIDGTNGTVALTGSFPAGWPGYWKAEDNSLVPITSIDEWKLFYAAMSAQGAANFLTSQGLKAMVDAAQTIAEVEAVAWPT